MYEFDQLIDRSNTQAYKLELRKQHFGSDQVLPLWVADMDFAAPLPVQRAILERAKHPVYGYTIREPKFKESIVKWVTVRHQWAIEPHWIEYSPGVVPALAFSVLAFTQPGDGIIIQPPIYPPFYSVVAHNERKLALNPLKKTPQGRYEIDFEHFEQLAQKPENKLLILCNPHNPVGRAWNKEELARLGEICLRHGILVLSDEIHSDVILWGKKHTPFASIAPELSQICITMMAPSKSFNIAGMNTSYVISSNAQLLSKYQKQQNALHLNMGHVFSAISLEAAYEYGAGWLQEMLAYVGENILVVQDYFQHHLPEIRFDKPEATYLLWIDFSELKKSQSELRKLMYEQARVGLNDGLTFGPEGEGFMRMNVASPLSLVQEGVERIHKAIRSISER